MKMYIYEVVNARGDVDINERDIDGNVVDLLNRFYCESIDDEIKITDVKDGLTTLVNNEESTIGVIFHENDIDELTKCILQNNVLKTFILGY